ncbi:restriction endonuclease subunit S [Catenisphaera adipataccumulans]|uniref:Type I restriction enzyme S subunit n=1 Tax=Catenisphaera adipataccumulans TaxID=700500 RepID=A0A7W8CW90_9FIRM|nr:restriction endonuclease subunit S [Catenisphaera adipataccumulans]MBB5182491.1 type I restriction enzyme S subunit [Catenisphaera adipataccumulans]
MKKKKAPDIRFKGFTDDWEQRELFEIADIIGGGTPSTSNPNYWDGEIDWYTPAEIGEQIFVNGSVRKITQEGLNNSSAKMLPANRTVLFTSRAGIGNMAILQRPGATNQGFQSLVCNEDIDPYFVFSMSEIIKARAETVAAGSTFSEISGKKLGELTFWFPESIEQRQIGHYFKNLDNLITLHQRKLESLKNVKKSMLEKMFPKNGEKNPKIRFKGFTDDWEQRKLLEITTMHARIGWQNLRTSEFLNDGDYYLITGTDFNDGKINFSNCHYVAKERYEQDKNIQIKNGCILITKDGTLGKVAYVSGLNKPATLNAGVFNVTIKTDNVDSTYLYQYLSGPYLMDYVSKRATGGTIKHLNQNILVDFPVILPSYQEQKKIGATLQGLDNLITLHQCKIDKLKTLKKALLNSMFI